MPKGNNIADFLEEVERDAEELLGWPELKIAGIEKFGTELSVKTDLGEIFISVQRLMEQYYFRIKAAEEFNLILSPIKKDVYSKWLKSWFTKIRDLRAEDGQLLDIVVEYLEKYLDKVDEEDINYLTLGRPVLIESGVFIAFRAEDFLVWLKKEYAITVSTDQIFFILRRHKCENKRIRVSGKQVRAWLYRRPAVEVEQPELDLK